VLWLLKRCKNDLYEAIDEYETEGHIDLAQFVYDDFITSEKD
jgi:hypothetical protein